MKFASMLPATHSQCPAQALTTANSCLKTLVSLMISFLRSHRGSCMVWKHAYLFLSTGKAESAHH